jgi:outer membrane protein OmpA-like peptidoglycan-associated protein
MTRKHLFTSLTALAFVGALAVPAHAEDFSLHLQLGAQQPLNDPQDVIDQTGPTLAAKGLFKLHPNFAVGPSVEGTYLPRADGFSNAGVLWLLGATARLQGNRETQAYGDNAVSPWLEATLAWAHTGDLNRPAFDVKLGMDVGLDRAHVAWIGPYIGYTHVFETSTTDGPFPKLDPRDYNALTGGVELSFDFPAMHTRTVVEQTHVVTVEKEVVRLVPRHCAACQAPAPEQWSERVYFNWDSAVLRWEESDKLDALARRLNAHPGAHVKVQGHASIDGQYDHNVVLSQKRTAAVVAYLEKHGVDASRLQSESFGPDKPWVTDAGKEGHERNRRVEFVIDFTVIDESK